MKLTTKDVTTKHKTFHQVSEIFPLMESHEFDRLCRDVAENGLRESIKVFQGEIIDGRNRYLACEKLGIEPHFEEWHGRGSLIGYVVSLNLHRRHLTDSQRAMVAAKVTEFRRGPKPKTSVVVKFDQKEIAQAFNTSARNMQRAGFVLKNGITEVVEAVEAGDITVRAACDIVTLPKTTQKRIISKGKKQIVQIAVNRRMKSIKPSNCLMCNKGKEVKQEDFLRFLYNAQQRFSKYSRFFSDIIEELENLEVSESIDDDYELIDNAIRLGYQTLSEIRKYTGFEPLLLEHYLRLRVEAKSLIIAEQGGKPDKARGSRKILYKLPEEKKVCDECYSLTDKYQKLSGKIICQECQKDKT